MDNAIQIKAGFAAFIAMLTALWGWFGWLCVAWTVCMAVDYISGTATACRDELAKYGEAGEMDATGRAYARGILKTLGFP